MTTDERETLATIVGLRAYLGAAEADARNPYVRRTVAELWAIVQRERDERQRFVVALVRERAAMMASFLHGVRVVPVDSPYRPAAVAEGLLRGQWRSLFLAPRQGNVVHLRAKPEVRPLLEAALLAWSRRGRTPRGQPKPAQALDALLAALDLPEHSPSAQRQARAREKRRA